MSVLRGPVATSSVRKALAGMGEGVGQGELAEQPAWATDRAPGEIARSKVAENAALNNTAAGLSLMDRFKHMKRRKVTRRLRSAARARTTPRSAPGTASGGRA